MTLKAMAVSDQVTTIVDNRSAVENVTRLARSKGFAVQVVEKPDGIHLVLSREGAGAEPVVSEQVVVCSTSGAAAGPLVLFVPSDCLGRGPAELGERLMSAYFHAQLETATKPKTIIFMNSGVRLAVEGSRALEDIRALERQGVEILACGTCLSYFELTEKLAVGRVSNMYDIATALLEAGRVVQL
jgi:selenium metabolism protein YedF